MGWVTNPWQTQWLPQTVLLLFHHSIEFCWPFDGWWYDPFFFEWVTTSHDGEILEGTNATHAQIVVGICPDLTHPGIGCKIYPLENTNKILMQRLYETFLGPMIGPELISWFPNVQP